MYPQWALPSDLLQYGVQNDLINRLTYEQLARITRATGTRSVNHILGSIQDQIPPALEILAQILSQSGASLKDVLHLLPPEMHLELHIIYPTKAEEEAYHLGPTPNMNAVVDSILSVVFDHASYLRGTNEGFIRSIVFSSYNADICTALNWKQPNCTSPLPFPIFHASPRPSLIRVNRPRPPL